MIKSTFGQMIPHYNKDAILVKSQNSWHQKYIYYMIFSWFFLDKNECDSNPCQNGGLCVDYPNLYVCNCLPGFAGVNCENSEYLLPWLPWLPAPSAPYSLCSLCSLLPFICRDMLPCLPGFAGVNCENSEYLLPLPFAVCSLHPLNSVSQ